jgi:hypothetical protein
MGISLCASAPMEARDARDSIRAAIRSAHAERARAREHDDGIAMQLHVGSLGDISLGCPWWFHDSPAGLTTSSIASSDGRDLQPRRLRRRRPRVHGGSRATHLWRSRTCGWPGRKIDAGLLVEEEARRLSHELACGLVRRACKL